MRTFNKTLISAIAASTMLAIVALPAAAAPNISESFERDLVNICQAVKDNKKLRLKIRLKRAGLTFQQISNDLVCNGMNVVDFAKHNNADLTGNLLAKYVRSDSQVLTAKKGY